MKPRGKLLPFVDKFQFACRYHELITAVFILLAGACGSRAQNTLSPLTVPTMADLRAMNATTFTNGTTAFVIDYYAASGSAGSTGYLQGQGGGLFRWWSNAHNVPTLNSGVATVDDGGRFIACNSYTNGIWERVLNGAVPNVKMWGAYGNGVAYDWVACQNALTACAWGWSGELEFPVGTYLMTNTLVCGTSVYVHGTQNTFARILMANNYLYDIFRTQNAQNAIVANNGSFSDDHGLRISDLYLAFVATNSWNSCLVVCAPGEANSIQRLHTELGAIGIRCVGSGTPGLWLRDCTVSDAAIAGISIEAVPGASYDNTGEGPVMLSGVSGDSRDAAYSPTSTLIRITNSVTTVVIDGIKAEGDFGGGVVQWSYPSASGFGTVYAAGFLDIRGATYNAGNIPETQTNGPVFVRLQGVGTTSTRTPSVLMQNLRLYGFPYLIDDKVFGRQIETDTDCCSQENGRLPIAYESQLWGTLTTNNVCAPADGSFSRYVIGQTAYSQFYATTTNWYRILQPILVNPAGHIAGRATVTVPGLESTEFQVDISPYATTPANAISLTLTRGPAAATTVLPVITAVRAMYYTEPSGPYIWAYVDVNVGNLPPTWNDKRVTVALDLAGQELRYTGGVQLIAPIKPLPAGYTMPAGAVWSSIPTVVR